jgi:hypothetical protein
LVSVLTRPVELLEGCFDTFKCSGASYNYFFHSVKISNSHRPSNTGVIIVY